MPTLIEIGSELNRLTALLELSDGEITGEVDAELTAVLGDLESKADSYAGLIRELELRSKAREEEAERMAALVARDRTTAKALRDRLKATMEATGQRKIETARFRLSVCNNGGKVPVDVFEPAEKLPEAYRRVEYKADVEAIRKALESGKELPFAALMERGTHLRVS